MKVLHDWLKDYVGDTLPEPEKVVDLLTFHAFEIEGLESENGHTVIDVDVLPNRSSDCLCHRGIAREIASIINTPLVHDPMRGELTLPKTDAIGVEIEDATTCPRFTASLIEGIDVRESPQWLRERLEALGQRSINNIVDATNYVMLAIGQPLHAYDADRFPQTNGTWQFGVRTAREGEVVRLIAESGKDEDRDVTLDGSELLIVDNSSDMPIGLAGVKGGSYAGVHEGTTRVIIEAAHFDPILTRKTAQRHGIMIDASKRFENEPSRGLPPYAQQEIVALIVKIAGGECAGIVDVYPNPREAVEVAVRPERVNALLGLSLESIEMQRILERIGATVQLSDDTLTATGPWERTDLMIEEDFIEEIGRIHGYGHIESITPKETPLAEINARHYYSERIRATLLALGHSEVVTSSFRKKDDVRLLNALASDKGYLRSSLRKNISEVLERNIQLTDLLGLPDVRVFEIGTVFEKGEGQVTEHVSLALGVRTKQQQYVPKDDEVLGEALSALETELGAPLHATVEKGVAEIDLTALLEQLPAPTAYEPHAVSEEIQYAPYSQYPFVTRDIAMWVNEGTGAADVEAVLNEAAGPLRVRTTLFDEFTKDGRTSYAFRLVFQSHEKTLTDSEVNDLMDRVTSAVAERGWEVR